MKEEKLMILSMLESGKITSEEAVKLLEALEDLEEYRSKDTEGHNINEEKYSKITKKTLEEIGLDIGDAFSNMISGLKDFSSSFGFNINSETISIDLEKDISTIDYPIIDLKAVNGSIKLSTSSDDKIYIKVDSQYKNGLLDNNKEFYNFYTEGNRVVFTPIYKNDISIKLNVLLPDKLYSEIILNTTNGKIDCININSDKINVVTANSSINLKDILAKQIHAYTANGRINLYNIDCEQMVCKTTNGTIESKDIKSEIIQLTTSNGKIICNNINTNKSKEIKLITSNGSISSEMNTLLKDVYFELETSMGSISLDLADMIYKINNQINLGTKKLVAHSANYNDNNNNLIFYATTSNGSIRIY